MAFHERSGETIESQGQFPALHRAAVDYFDGWAGPGANVVDFGETFKYP